MTARKRKRGPGRPPLPAKERRVDVHVRLSPLALRELDALAKEWSLSRTGALEECILFAKEKHP